MGGTYTPSKDQTLDALVSQLGLSPKRPSSGGFNPQKLRTVGGNLVYVEHPDLPPVVLYTAGMSEAERQRNAIALEQVNAYRKRNGDVPLVFASDLEAAPAAATEAPQSAPAPSVQPAPPKSGVTLEPQPQATAAPTNTQPRSPVLVPQPGAKPPLARPSYGRARSTGRASSGGDGQAQEIGRTQALGAIRDIEAARAQADRLYKAGKYDEADSYLNQANAVADALSKNPNTAGVVQITSAPDHRGKSWPQVTMKAAPAPISGAPSGGAYSGQVFRRSDLPRISQKLNMMPDDAARYIESHGGRLQ